VDEHWLDNAKNSREKQCVGRWSIFKLSSYPSI